MASVGAALCLAYSTAGAQTQLSDQDRQFLDMAAKGGHAEVVMGQQALESENPDVKAFGQKMIDDHGKMNQELATVAQQKGIEPPESPDLASQAKSMMMEVLPGQTFDSQYVSSQLDDHKETLELYQRQAQEGQDPDLKALAQKGIPIIQQHIAELEQLQKKPELQ
jgi:putative membrane protein